MDTTKDLALESIITNAVQIPGVKVNRRAFLSEVFETNEEKLSEIVDSDPISAGIDREELSAIANKLILKRTSQSSAASFIAGIPGGLAMAATIPADVLQFFGMTLRLAQELAYLYGAQDLWQNGEINDDRVKNQLILYCGVMFGVSGAVSGVRVLTSQIAKVTLKKLPQKALTKTFWYPIIKQIGKAIGVKVTKSTVAKGVSKAIPVVGGIISGGLNFASMMPMAKRLYTVLDESCFDYTEEALEEDIETIENVDFTDAENDQAEASETDVKEKVTKGLGNLKSGVSEIFKRKANKNDNAPSTDDILATIEKLSQLKNAGVISDEEFNIKKAELLEKI